jgi:hypothetical protein
MLQTSSPEAHAEIAPEHDRRRPYVGQVILFHARDPISTVWPPTKPYPAVVMQLDRDDHDRIDLLMFGGPGVLDRHYVPRKTDQNCADSWSFTDWDEKNYHPQVEARSDGD